MFELAVIIIAIALLPLAIAVVIGVLPWLLLAAAVVAGFIVFLVLLVYKPGALIGLLVFGGSIWLVVAVTNHIEQKRREAQRRKEIEQYQRETERQTRWRQTDTRNLLLAQEAALTRTGKVPAITPPIASDEPPGHHTHYCNRCGCDWRHEAPCTRRPLQCLWCSQDPNESPPRGLRPAPHKHSCTSCGEPWEHLQACMLPYQSALPESHTCHQ